LGGGQPPVDPGYGDMDPVNAQGMFDGARVGMGDDGGDEDVDEYFDDAGDIGYLPADHVSFTKIEVLE